MFLDDVYINGSRSLQMLLLNQNTGLQLHQASNANIWAGDKEYFLIMNIALGGNTLELKKWEYWE